MRTHSVCQFVTASSIREDIVRHLSNQPQPTPKLIDKLDACRSGVYKELSNLKQRGALTEAEEGWELTACGQLVTDTIAQRQVTEEFLGHDLEYWQHHDIDLLPDRYRQQLPNIGAYEIVRGEMPAVHAHVSELLTRLESSDSCDILTPIFVEGLEEAIPDSPGTRVLVTSEVYDRFSGDPERVSVFSDAEVRTIPTEFAVSRTDDSLCLVLPNRADGEWQATMVAESSAATQWGADLFESLWADGTPVDDEDDTTFTMTGRRGWVGVSQSNSSGHY